MERGAFRRETHQVYVTRNTPKSDYSLHPASLEGNKLASAAEWNECVNTFVVEGGKRAKDRDTQADHGREYRLWHETVPAMSPAEVQPLSPCPPL